ncbi:YjbH domain-containing protein [Rhodobacteraceae bacterium 2CG4]|uniref:YjbH domain-containing protein n=1 Tax=Halovulum marinum TaxID=2662447 RepID=A0A6L5Z340_9RHOB|nr:YjbH domain-containing protein [Halovulum marinum]MSU90699.1 YjbH domain-containing protein [Halovulum marinum]
MRHGVFAVTMAAAVAALTGGAARAQTLNLYGNPGLLDLPTAETLPDGEVTATYGQIQHSQRSSIGFQLLPRVYGTIRLSEIQDVPGGPSVSARGFDLRFQLLEEDGLLPGVALGLRDFLGDGPYGAEYLVASKTVIPGLTLTGGIGWGRLGGEASLGKPFGDRGAVTDPTGQLQFDRYFQGDAAVFGGVAWDTPIDGLRLMAEYSPDSYDAEEAGGFDRASPFNIGAAYSPNDHVQLSAAWMYGSAFGFQVSFSGNPNDPLAPQDLGTGPAPVRARAADAPMGTAWADNPDSQRQLLAALSEVLAADGIGIDEARITGTSIDLYLVNTRIQRRAKAIGRVTRVLALAMPPSVETFNITLLNDGLPVTTAQIRRSDVEAQVDRPGAALDSWQSTRLTDARAQIAGEGVYRRPIAPRFSWGIGPTIPINLLDVDDGFKPDVQINATATYQFSRGLSVSGELSSFVIGTEQKTVSTSTSPLPHVRSDSDLYYSGRDIDIERLTADYVFKIAPNLYGRTSAGILERMFSGVSTEVLWAPVDADLALGGEVNYVRQRDIDDPFELQDYDVVTGHASVYWDTGWNGVEAQLDAGRYLAGDWGATLSLSRRFANGWEVRAYATGTDVSFEDFGEGSFAKGVEMTIPLRWGAPFETKSEVRAELIPTESDGGARLDVQGRLYGRVRDLDRASLRDGWSAFWQ